MSTLKSSRLLGTLILLLGNLSLPVQASGLTQSNAIIAQSPPTSAPLQLTEQSLCPADLADAIKQKIEQPNLRRSRWGILVQTLESKEILYQLNADQFFTPASNTKLFTTAAALQKLGADFRIRTPVLRDWGSS